MKHFDPRIASVVALTVSLAACVTAPTASTVPVIPGKNKSFEAFAADQTLCQQYATAQTAPQAAAANNRAVGTALVTTALGAGLGAAVGGGGWHGNAGRGAGIGAAGGAVAGTALGAGQSSFAQMSLQQQFDVMYGECMYAHGNQVPGFSPPPGTPPYAGGTGRSSYGPPPSYQGGRDPSPYGPSSYQGGPGPSPYGPSSYQDGPGASPYGPLSYPGGPGASPYGPPPSY